MQSSRACALEDFSSLSGEIGTKIKNRRVKADYWGKLLLILNFTTCGDRVAAHF